MIEYNIPIMWDNAAECMLMDMKYEDCVLGDIEYTLKYSDIPFSCHHHYDDDHIYLDVFFQEANEQSSKVIQMKMHKETEEGELQCGEDMMDLAKMILEHCIQMNRHLCRHQSKLLDSKIDWTQHCLRIAEKNGALIHEII